MMLSIGFSPCPNDCFIFDALVHKKVDTEGLEFKVQLEDVETLNQLAVKSTLDITKLSFHAYGHVIHNYILLRAGSALGFNCGPLLVARKNIPLQEIRSVAIPGKLTTASFLLSLALPDLYDKREFVFSEIEDAVLEGKVDAGLIIHENRFTYADKGLVKIMDLGEYWDSLIHAPIPLGGIVIKRELGEVLQQKVNRVIRRSVEYAFSHPEGTMEYVKAHAQAMSEEVMKKHIALYVNEFSLDLGKKGMEAVELLFSEARKLRLFTVPEVPVMIS